MIIRTIAYQPGVEINIETEFVGEGLASLCIDRWYLLNGWTAAYQSPV